MAIVQGRYHRLRVLCTHLFLITLLGILISPLLIVISISLRPGNLALGDLIPQQISWEHWQAALGIPYTDPQGNRVDPPFPVLIWLWNSIKVSALAAGLQVLLSLTCAYAFARLRFRYKSAIVNSLLLLQIFPSVLALIAIYAIVSTVGDIIPALGLDTHGGLILAYLGGISVSIWMIKGYYEQIPIAMEEAAQIDGANPWQTLLYVLLPISYPILAVVFILTFITTFNEFPLASILLLGEEQLTLAVGLRFFLQDQNFLWGDFAAAAILGGFPITLIFLISQGFLISGLSEGGTKE